MLRMKNCRESRKRPAVLIAAALIALIVLAAAGCGAGGGTGQGNEAGETAAEAVEESPSDESAGGESAAERESSGAAGAAAEGATSGKPASAELPSDESAAGESATAESSIAEPGEQQTVSVGSEETSAESVAERGSSGGAGAAAEGAISGESASAELPSGGAISNTRTAPDGFELHMLDVGQGTSILVKADGHYLLYDGGGRDTSSFVVAYLKDQGVETLDYIVVSHYDTDHLSGIVGALHVFDVGTILAPDYEADTSIYRSYLSAAAENGAEIIYPQQGQRYSLGGAEITVVGPYTYTYTEENDRCVAIRIDYGGASCLMCGDTQDQGEREITASGAELDADVYVVDHHGSATSTRADFLEKISPEYALISCGAENAYGHPAAEVMERLRTAGCRLYRTDIQGTVTAYSDGQSFRFDQAPCQDWSAGAALESAGGSAGNTAEALEGAGESAGNAAAALESAGESAGNATAAVEYTYVCNKNTKKFHRSGCSSVNQMSEKNKLFTNESRDALIAQGYSPCKNCNP